jgi:TPR repeat protein
MDDSYYKSCHELDVCNDLIKRYWDTQEYDKCFKGHLALAEKGYPLAECQVGYFYLEGLGIEKDFERAFYWTHRAAEHGDRDAQYNLASFYESETGVKRDMELAEYWYKQAALQNHDLAIKKVDQ